MALSAAALVPALAVLVLALAGAGAGTGTPPHAPMRCPIGERLKSAPSPLTFRSEQPEDRAVVGAVVAVVCDAVTKVMGHARCNVSTMRGIQCRVECVACNK